MAFNQQYTSGKISGDEIDLKKIYATKANAQSKVGEVTISEKNASWKSDDLTYSIKDGGVVLICNHGIPIGYTNLDALNDVSELKSSNETIEEDYKETPSQNTILEQETKNIKKEDTTMSSSFENDLEEDSSEEIPNVENIESNTSIEENYEEEQVEEVKEVPQEEKVEETTVIEETYEEEKVEEVKEVPQEEKVEETTVIEENYEEDKIEEVEEVKEEPVIEETQPEIEIEETVPEPPIDVETIDVQQDVEASTSINNEYPSREQLINEYAAKIEAYGGNGTNNSSFNNNVKNSGNPEVFLINMGKLLNSVDLLQQKFNADGQGYSFKSSCFSGGAGHVSGDTRPSHGMGSKCDLHFYKNGVELNIGVNSTREDWAYITHCLNTCGLGVQFEKGNSTWGDVFLQSALNSQNIEVAYDGIGWGKPMTYTNSSGGNMRDI